MTLNQRIIAGIILLFAVVTAGCAPAISPLGKDSLDQDQGLVIVRLRIKDETRKFIKYAPVVHVARAEGRDFLDVYGDPEENKKKGKRKRGNYYWDEKDDAIYFDQFFFITAKPGKYLLNTGISGQNVRYHIPLNIGCDLRSGELVVAGTMDIVIEKMSGVFTNNEITYKTNWIRDNDARGAILERFKAAYPDLSRDLAVKGGAGQAYYAYYDTFKDEGFIPSDNPSDGNRWRRWDSPDTQDPKLFSAFVHRSYALSAGYDDKSAYGYGGLKNRLSLPGNYTADYAIRWMEGMKDAFYGLRLAQDDKNAYFFGVSADGRPAIWIKKDGAWQPKPQVKETSMIRASKTTADDFSVEVRNDQITYKINGEPVGSFAGVLDIRSAYAGFFVSGKQKVEVDFIKIIERQ